MNGFWSNYTAWTRALAREWLIQICSGHDTCFQDIHDWEISERVLQVLWTPTTPLNGDINYRHNRSVEGVCHETDRQFYRMVDPNNYLYRRSLIVRLGGLPVWIMKWFTVDMETEHKHLCSLNTFILPNWSRMYFWGLYSPSSEQFWCIGDVLQKKRKEYSNALKAGKWPVIDLGGINLVPRRFLRGWILSENTPIFYDNLDRERQLLYGKFDDNAVVISR